MIKVPRIVVVGSLNMDVIIETERVPQMGETVLGHNVHFLPGGKGANQAVATSKLGADTVLIGTVGNDAFGHELLRSLKANGISQRTIKILDGVATGTASIVLSGGDNRIIVVPGANSYCLPEQIDAHEADIASADLVIVQLEIPLETVEYAVKIAKRYGRRVIVNPAPARVLSDSLLQNIDYLTPNESELILLAEMTSQVNPDMRVAMDNLIALGVGCIVATLGADGAAYTQQDRLSRTESAKLIHVPGKKVSVIDTTGAGDSFNAGLGYALATGKSIHESVEFAIDVSALAVTKLGAQQGMPTLKEVEQFQKA